MKSNVKTAVMTGALEAKVIERTLPKLKGHDVLVKVAACNICTSEYGVFNGSRTNRPFPLVYGHEWAGYVEAVGEEVVSVEVGDYVASGYDYNPYSIPSRDGRTGECPYVSGANKDNGDGTFGNPGCAEYTVISEVALYKMDKGVDPSAAAFLEPVGTVCNGLRHMDMAFGESLLIIGAGTMGILNALVARAYGLNVFVSEMMENKINTARALGLTVINPKETDIEAYIKEKTQGQGVDGVVIAVGATPAYDQAIKLVKNKRGKLLLFAAGYPSPELNIDANNIHYRRMKVIGCYGADYMDFKMAASLINRKAINLEPLIDEKFGLEDIQKAMEASIVPGKYRVSVLCNHLQ